MAQSESEIQPLSSGALAVAGGRRGVLARLRPYVRRIDAKAAVGFAILLVWVLSALIGPALMQVDPNAQDLTEALKPMVWSAEGSWQHVFGTDHLGRDIFTRVVYGARNSLLIGLVVVAGSSFIGTFIGVVAAQGGGIVDELLMRLADIQLSIPFFLLAVAVLAIVGGSVENLVLVLMISGWVPYARVVRSELLYIRETEFILAAKAIGAGRLRIMLNYLLPSTRSLVIVTATLQLADVVLLSAALSFLGVGLQPPAVSWGTMLADGRDYLSTEWWIATMPGVAITLAILSVNLTGDWLSDVMNPRIGRKSRQ